MGPDGDEEGYFALAEALKKRDAVGIAHWVLRNKRYVGALQASGGYLLLDTLRYAQEVVEVGAVRPNANRAPDKREIALAEQLIGALEDRFDPNEFRDEYQGQLKGLLAAKAAGKVVRFPKAPKRQAHRFAGREPASEPEVPAQGGEPWPPSVRARRIRARFGAAR